MAKRDKQLAKIRRSTKNVSPRELDALLRGFGFNVSRQRGSHRTYLHPDFAGRLLIAQHRPLDVQAVKDAIDAIDEVSAREE